VEVGEALCFSLWKTENSQSQLQHGVIQQGDLSVFAVGLIPSMAAAACKKTSSLESKT